MIDVAEAIDAEAVSVQWYASIGAGSHDSNTGKFVPGSATATPIMATVQPATGRNLMDAPEGIRAEARFAIWTRSTIQITQQIDYEGDRYKIIWVAPRPVDGFVKGALGLLSS